MPDPLTEQIIAAAIEVHRILGPGLLESIYEEALCYELAQRGLSFERQKAVDVIYKGHVINGQRLDLVVNGEVLNTTVFPKKLVTLEVAIVGASGEIVARQEAMAGITLLTSDQIAGLGDIEMLERHEEDSKTAESWVIRSDRKGSFQALFTTFPPGVEDPALYKIEAKVISATNAGSGEE